MSIPQLSNNPRSRIHTRTLIVDNFGGRLTRFNNGNINSGFAKYTPTFGNDPFTNPGQLSWMEAPTEIAYFNSGVTDLIVAAKTRIESGITYVYAIGYNKNLYKIQVNDPTTYNPKYNNTVLVTTLSVTAGGLGASGFTYGSQIQFFGNTQRIYFSHDLGVSYINFDGTGETYINGSAVGSSNPMFHPIVPFLSYLVMGGLENFFLLSTTNTLVPNSTGNFAYLIPGFAIDDYVRDLDVSPDGLYLQIIVSKTPAVAIGVATQDTTSLFSSDSHKFYWDGIGLGASSYETFTSYSANSNITFGQFSYTGAYDSGGASFYLNGQKILSLPNLITPTTQSEFSTGNMLGFATPDFSSVPPYSGMGQNASLMLYGQYDDEIPLGLYRLFRQAAKSTGGAIELDIIQVPICLVVSNLFYGSSTSGYASSRVGVSQIFFSTLETSASTTRYRFYSFTLVPTGNTAIQGVYETQTELFGRKATIAQVRVYGEPWVIGNSFKIDLIGSDGNPIVNGSKTLTCQSTDPAAPMYLDTDYAWVDIDCAPTYCLGVRVTNLGPTNFKLNKIEVDIDLIGGK